jgi:hypothetical protein
MDALLRAASGLNGYQIPGEQLNTERRPDTAALTQIHKKNRAAANRTEREKKRQTPAPRKTRSVRQKILRAARKWPAEEPSAREVTRKTKVKSRHRKQHGGENNLGDETKNRRAEAKSPSEAQLLRSWVPSWLSSDGHTTETKSSEHEKSHILKRHKARCKNNFFIEIQGESYNYGAHRPLSLI